MTNFREKVTFKEAGASKHGGNIMEMWKEAEAKYIGEEVEQLLSAHCMPNSFPHAII